MATLHIRNVRWEVECESCGIIDSGITRKAIAETLSEAHAEMHQPCCDAIRPAHVLNCREIQRARLTAPSADAKEIHQ